IRGMPMETAKYLGFSDGLEEGEAEGEGGSAGEEATTEAEGEEERESSGQQLAAPVYYALHFFTLPWRILLLCLLIAGAFLYRFLSRRTWRKKVQQLSPEGTVINYYQYFLKRLGRAGFQKPDSYTLAEYAKNMEHDLSAFTAGDENCSFAHLTEIYTTVFYGMRTIGKKEVQLFEQFFEVFDQNLRKEIGWPRYILKVFWR
ncbi:MAG: DUF4129 domain-containing protein, partial [Clostridiales bacterium]|nr:DUF4129 domain-containing protein [Clostridiales bacterium]